MKPILMVSVVAAIIAAAQPVAAEEKPRPMFEVVKLYREVEHSIQGGKIDYKSEGFKEAFEVEGGLLHSYTIHVVSRRNVDGLSVTSDKNRLVIKGRVYRDPLWGGGGKYKARVTAVFLRAVEAVDPGDFELDLLKYTAESTNEKVIRRTHRRIVQSVQAIGRKYRID